MPRKQVRSKNYCFTLNNYTDDDEKRLEELECSYLVYGRELAPTTGTPHLQGYIQFAKRVDASKLRKLLLWHIEVAKGTAQQNRDYCTKSESGSTISGGIVERGTIRHDESGRRTDLQEIKKKILNHVPLIEIVPYCDNHQQLKYAEGLSKYFNDDKDRAVEVYWYYGPTGTGKTRAAREESTGLSRWMSKGDLQWFDGYAGQTAVILDDLRLRPNTTDYSLLLRLLDRYPLSVPIKGGFVNWTPMKIWVTCPYPPDGIPGTTEDYTQLVRRMTIIKRFD